MSSESRIIPGPEINGRKTSIHLFEANELEVSPLLPSFLPPINAAFSARHPPWIPASWIRLSTTASWLEELGPEAFTYGLAYDDDIEKTTEILATVSARPFRWREPELQDPKYRTFYWEKKYAIVPGAETWELKHMAVDPKMQRNGLASLMMGLVETEIRRRFKEKKLNDAKITSKDGEKDEGGKEVAQRRLRLVLHTLYEMNGEFYKKRGWTLIDQRKKGVGFMESEVGFTVAFMEKVFDF